MPSENSDRSASVTGEASPPPHVTNRERRIADLIALMKIMTELGRSVTIDPPPVPVSLTEPAQLAKDAAASATHIAIAAASLGMPGEDANNEHHQDVLWKETLNQIERIQDLYNLGRLPFQDQAKSEPASAQSNSA